MGACDPQREASSELIKETVPQACARIFKVQIATEVTAQ